MIILGDYPRGYREGVRATGRWHMGDVVRIDGIRYTVIEVDRAQLLLDRPLEDIVPHMTEIVWENRVTGGFRWETES